MGVEYDGQPYCGWQRQKHGRSVQSAVEEALARVADHPLGVHCAGRTDTGVHAREQVIHFESTAQRSTRAWVLGCNRWLPHSISMLWAREVPTDFHARFSARARSYRYHILNRGVRPALQDQRVAWVPQALDVAQMARAVRCLLGEHDFSAFRASGCQSREPVRNISHVEILQSEKCITLDITANGFLHHMVRNIAGTLIEVGRARRAPGWVAEVLASRDRRQAGATAPAGGLYFHHVDYPDSYALPQLA